MTQPPAVRINKISFVGKDIEPAELVFPGTLSFIYGASNTGKSFAVKALDFMFGASRELPAIIERRPYNRIQLDLQVAKEDLVIERAIAGGDFQYVAADGTTQTLSARHNRDNETNLSNFLLARLGIAGREIARDKSGTKKPLSFRDIARFCVTDETAIQAETSPVESGDLILAQSERNAFKFLLTGDDDSALITQEKATDFRTGKTAQLRFIEEMIGQIDTEIAEDYPDVEKLDDLAEQVADALEQVEADIIAARTSARMLLDHKRDLSKQIGVDQQRVADIAVTLDNFEQLQSVYASDISRLEAIEEAGFLFSVDANMDCPVCGAPPDKQVLDHGLVEINRARVAAEAEIAKIRLHQRELRNTTADTVAELNATGERLLANQTALQTVEKELNAASPNAGDQQRRFVEIIPRRDRIKRGLDLVSRREDLEKQRVRIEGAKQVKPKSNFQPGLGTQTAQDFADEVGLVLGEWGFPGQRRVVFDLQTYDLIIDGKARRDNGKGVRAITHAAFKVGLLIFCRKRQLPHPGFVVLDSPLITYRDPIRSNLGPLDDEETAIRASDLKDKFFAHLSSLGGLGQIVLFDNADPPRDGARFASIETFTNDSMQGRQGLFKVIAPDPYPDDLIG